MQALVDFLSQFGAWLWFVAAVVFFVLETIVPGIHFLWFGLAAAAVGVLALLAPISFQWQLVAFALTALATVNWVRKYARPDVAKSDEPQLNVRGAQYIGRKVVVEDAIRSGRGKVRVGDTLWAAEGEEAPRGSEVVVTGVNGTVLVVERTDTDWGEK